PGREVANYDFVAERLADPVGFDHEPPRGSALTDAEPDIALHTARFAALLTHTLQLGYAADVALTARRDAAVHPALFARDLAVELVPLDLLLLEYFVPPGLEGTEALLEPPRDAPVEPN